MSMHKTTRTHLVYQSHAAPVQIQGHEQELHGLVRTLTQYDKTGKKEKISFHRCFEAKGLVISGLHPLTTPRLQTRGGEHYCRFKCNRWKLGTQTALSGPHPFGSVVVHAILGQMPNWEQVTERGTAHNNHFNISKSFVCPRRQKERFTASAIYDGRLRV